MEFTLKLLKEHAELTTQNAVLEWRLKQYEHLLDQVMAYLCEDDVLAARYAIQYKSLRHIGLQGDKIND